MYPMFRCLAFALLLTVGCSDSNNQSDGAAADAGRDQLAFADASLVDLRADVSVDAAADVALADSLVLDTTSDAASTDTQASDAQPGDAQDSATADGTLADGGGSDAGCAGSAGTINATIGVATDDHYSLWVNGVLIDSTVRPWNSPQVYTVPIFSHPSKTNVIAVQGNNTAKIDGRDRGSILELRYATGGNTFVVATDNTWKLNTTLLTGWEQLAFNDSGWTPAVEVGNHGDAPWGAILASLFTPPPSSVTAKWLWSFDSNLPAAQKQTAETIYLRKRFSISQSGAPTPGATVLCP